ncbi:MAG: hypothetical protein JST04_00250 [Bdellovibrionales bacterium]|nr:hypothetical protein [Bdellovibrionales bacterium]
MRILFSFLLLAATGCASASKSPESVGLSELVAATKHAGTIPKTFGSGKSAYSVAVHSAGLAPLLKEKYDDADKAAVRRALGTALDFSLDSRGLARAADRVDEKANDPTHYDAVWVRDSLWVYLGLKSEDADAAAAKKLLLTLSDYFSSPAQSARFDAVIDNPLVLKAADGAMQAVHIRFDRNSPTFADVQENGKPQAWNHKQNDALGLFVDLFCRAVLSGEVTDAELTPERKAMIGRFAKYFAAVKFEQMSDAGSWEEIERVNSSSIGLVISGLERLVAVREKFPDVKIAPLNAMIERGYKKLFKQLEAGGESPGYAPEDSHYRTSDAALLNLIFPAKLSQFRIAHFRAILKAVAPLVGEVGVKRYIGDSYQSGNFWFGMGRTDDTSSEQSFTDRGSKFIAGSEAQWFFDSWLAVALGVLAKRYPKATFGEDIAKHLNRALAQVTGNPSGEAVLGADGRPVPTKSLPESYNTVVDTKSGDRVYAPSPITPLNWAKAALRLALSAD